MHHVRDYVKVRVLQRVQMIAQEHAGLTVQMIVQERVREPVSQDVQIRAKIHAQVRVLVDVLELAPMLAVDAVMYAVVDAEDRAM